MIGHRVRLRLQAAAHPAIRRWTCMVLTRQATVQVVHSQKNAGICCSLLAAHQGCAAGEGLPVSGTVSESGEAAPSANACADHSFSHTASRTF